MRKKLYEFMHTEFPGITFHLEKSDRIGCYDLYRMEKSGGAKLGVILNIHDYECLLFYGCEGVTFRSCTLLQFHYYMEFLENFKNQLESTQ